MPGGHRPQSEGGWVFGLPPLDRRLCWRQIRTAEVAGFTCCFIETSTYGRYFRSTCWFSSSQRSTSMYRAPPHPCADTSAPPA